ncbi:metal-dependent phosphohydrolase [Desulfosarcina widdelii]|uniref:Metal-dependent phosphohydrolase n=1 Tax=Desulfosarcina widdelii TaxID=947919 RepID=A0A5K7ZB88_9BACT|nr:HD domain-containing protein [Desulfosarcina widdelii]BBO73637.1 metal-dependent phosphohydrolase [Desulfosarcina widdelii]
MQSIHLSDIQSWFSDYTRSFLTGEPNKDSAHQLKIDHTARVCKNIRMLAASIDLSEDQMRIAEAVALLHDLGRFEQYKRYGTFNDRKSVNHAALGVEIMEKTGVLEDLDDDERKRIVDAVRFHNAPALPSGKPPEELIFLRLIRDADKLDIWKVFADYYRYDNEPETAIVQHLPDRPTWAPSIIEDIVNRRMARFSHMETLNDFKLLQLSWVFDLNFPETYFLARQRGDLAVIAGSLPDVPSLRRAVAVVMEELEVKGKRG